MKTFWISVLCTFCFGASTIWLNNDYIKSTPYEGTIIGLIKTPKDTSYDLSAVIELKDGTTFTKPITPEVYETAKLCDEVHGTVKGWEFVEPDELFSTFILYCIIPGLIWMFSLAGMVINVIIHVYSLVQAHRRSNKM